MYLRTKVEPTPVGVKAHVIDRMLNLALRGRRDAHRRSAQTVNYVKPLLEAVLVLRDWLLERDIDTSLFSAAAGLTGRVEIRLDLSDATYAGGDYMEGLEALDDTKLDSLCEYLLRDCSLVTKSDPRIEP